MKSTNGTGVRPWLTIQGWFPSHAVVVPTTNGSMEKGIVSLLVDHIERNVRKFVPVGKTLSSTLMGTRHGMGLTGWSPVWKKELRLSRAQRTLRIYCSPATHLLTNVSRMQYEHSGIYFVA